MIVVHHLENSRSQRILWLLEELGVEYDVKIYQRDKKTNLAPAALKKVHPLGKSPVIEDNGHVIAETGAMIEYILDQYGDGRLRPASGTDLFLRYRYWLHAAEGSYASILVMMLLINKMETAPMPFFARPIAKKITRAVRDGYLDHTAKALFDYAHDELVRSPWLAGDEISAADIIMSFPFEGLSARGDTKRYPKIAEFVERVQTRPAYIRAIERGGPYALLR